MKKEPITFARVTAVVASLARSVRSLGARVRRRGQESEEYFRLAFAEAPVGMAFVDLDGRFVRVNRALCEIVGYSCEELTAARFQSITHPSDVEADEELTRRLLRG